MRRSQEFAASRVVLESGRVLTQCDQCREMWRERNERGVEGSPPCEGCMVILEDGNLEAAQIYQIVQGQVRTRFNGQVDEVIDLDYNAVKTVMDLWGVRDQRGCLEKIRATFYFFLNKEREEHGQNHQLAHRSL